MIIRYDPFQEFDRLSRQTWGARSLFGSPGTAMPMDVRRFADRVEAVFDLPGVEPASIDVTVEKDTLTVKTERTAPAPAEGEEVLVNERPQGSFSRQLSLGRSLDSTKVSARYDRGVLTVTVPLSETARAQKVQVTVGDGEASGPSPSIEAESSEAA